MLPFTLYYNLNPFTLREQTHTRNIKRATVSHPLKLDWWLIDSCLFGFGQKKCSQQNAPSREAASKLAWSIHALCEPQQTVAIFGFSWTWTSACSRCCYCFAIAISVCVGIRHTLRWAGQKFANSVAPLRSIADSIKRVNWWIYNEQSGAHSRTIVRHQQQQQ